MDVGLPTLEPFVVYKVADVLAPLLIVELIQISEVLSHVSLLIRLYPNVEHLLELGKVQVDLRLVHPFLQPQT